MADKDKRYMVGIECPHCGYFYTCGGSTGKLYIENYLNAWNRVITRTSKLKMYECPLHGDTLAPKVIELEEYNKIYKTKAY